MLSFSDFLEKHYSPCSKQLEISQNILVIKNLTGNNLRVFLIISYFTRPSGFCDVDNITLEQQFPVMNGNLFKYYLSRLQKKDMLFKKRVPVPKRGGSRRILVLTSIPGKCN